jgi:A/G-specific adenine glycosylase
MLEFLTDEVKVGFRDALLGWFSVNGRYFPWRETRDPYHILVVEKLLQQTSVRNSMVSIYTHLINDYPTPRELSGANIQDIREIILPLGLHYRANDLVLLGKDLVEKFDSKVPTTLNELLSIYGVGDYSARAVLSFAYGQDVPVVDTNVARILFRVFRIDRKFPVNPARSKYLINLASNLLPSGLSREFNWAIIDLGAIVCKSTKPNCTLSRLLKNSKTGLEAADLLSRSMDEAIEHIRALKGWK